MIQMPYPEIIAKITKEKSISESEIEEKIKQKMDVLSGLISKDGAAYIVANELGVQLVKTEGLLKIKEVLIGMRSLETAGKVVRKFPINEFERNGRSGRVGSFMMADETGQIRVTAWHDMTDVLNQFKEGDIVKIIGGYVRENNGFKEIHLNTNSKILVNPEDIQIKVDIPVGETAPAGAERKKISELTESDENIEIFGTVVQVFDIKFWPACPNCNKKAVQTEDGFRCNEHGVVTPNYSYVMNAIIDDGTDNMRVAFFRNQANALFKATEEEMQKFRSDPEGFEKLKTDLLGEPVKIVGRVKKNDMFDRLELQARLVFPDVKADEEIEKLKEQGVPEESSASTEKPDISGTSEESEKPKDTEPSGQEEPASEQKEEPAEPEKHEAEEPTPQDTESKEVPMFDGEPKTDSVEGEKVQAVEDKEPDYGLKPIEDVSETDSKAVPTKDSEVMKEEPKEELKPIEETSEEKEEPKPIEETTEDELKPIEEEPDEVKPEPKEEPKSVDETPKEELKPVEMSDETEPEEPAEKTEEPESENAEKKKLPSIDDL